MLSSLGLNWNHPLVLGVVISFSDFSPTTVIIASNFVLAFVPKKERVILEKELTQLIIKEDEKRGISSTQTAWKLDEVNKLIKNSGGLIKEQDRLNILNGESLEIENKLTKAILNRAIIQQLQEPKILQL